MLVLLTFLLRIKKMSQKKSVIFKHLLPVIKQYQQVGFTHEKIVALELYSNHQSLDKRLTQGLKPFLEPYLTIHSFSMNMKYQKS